MDVVSVVVLIVALFTQHKEKVNESHGRDCVELLTVAYWVSSRRSKRPSQGHAEQHPNHGTLSEHFSNCEQ